MRSLLRRALLAALCVGAVPAYGSLQKVDTARTSGLTPDAVALRVQDRDTGRDSRAEMRMRLFDRQGRVRERVMTLLTLRTTSSSRKTPGQGDKTLVRFTYPNDIRGTSFLVWEHPGADDERFLYLPALGRVRRIAGEEKQESFVGSDLSYEDIGGRDVADYTYAFADEDASWTGPDGAKHPAWLLESRAKVFDVRRLEQVGGIWTVLDLVVVNERDRTRTELTTSAIRYDVGLTDDDFSRRELELGVR